MTAPLAFVDAASIRENVVRAQFGIPVFFSTLLEAQDASRPELWSVVADATTTGMAGDVARPVAIVGVSLPGLADGIAEADVGRYVDLALDRPMTPYPAVYAVSWTSIFAFDKSSSLSGTSSIFGVYRVLDTPSIEVPRRSRDFANPQSLSGARASLARPNDPFALGTFGLDDTGDYAHDEGIESLKKRVSRRLMTRKGAFAHLPLYGVGVPDESKRLGTVEVLTRLKVDAESQIAEEPEVSRVRVVVVTSSTRPDLFRFRVAIETKTGPVVSFDVPFDRAA